MTAVKRCLAVLMVVVLAVTMLDSGADAHKRRRHKHKKDKNTNVEERQVSNLGVTLDFEDREPAAPLGGGLLLDDDPDLFQGTISGFKAACQGRILAEVFHADGEAVGSAEASDSGSYSLIYEDPNRGDETAQYFARATRFGTGKGARFACGKGISDTITVTDGDASLF